MLSHILQLNRDKIFLSESLAAPLSPALGIVFLIETQFVTQERFERESSAFLFPLQIAFHLLSLFGAAQSTDAEPDFAVRRIDTNDLGFHLIANLV
jgi:hypothetical protein